MERLKFEGETIVGSAFTTDSTAIFTSIGSVFEKCDFSGVRFSHMSFGAGTKTSIYRECVFDGARLVLPPGGVARFEHCSFANVRISHWNSWSTELVQCRFSGKLSQSIFWATVEENYRAQIGRTENQFYGNNFSECELVDVTFRGIDLAAQDGLPTGPDYAFFPDGEAALDEARYRVEGWPNPRLRELVRPTIEALQIHLGLGHRTMLFRPKDFIRRGDKEKVIALKIAFGMPIESWEQPLVDALNGEVKL